MSWITLDNLKRFWKGIRTNPVTFTGEIDLQNITRYKGKEIATKADVEAGGSNITVDDALSVTSTNPVQNKVVKTELDKKAPLTFGATTLQTNDFSKCLELHTSKDGYSTAIRVSSDAAFSEGETQIGGNMIQISPTGRSGLLLSANGWGMLDGHGAGILLRGTLNDPSGNTKKYALTFEKDKLNYRDSSGATPLATEDYVKTSIPTKTSQLTNDSGFAVISNGHLVINGSELWVE